MLVGVKALRVDAPVADDVAVGLGDVSSPAAQVPLVAAAVHKVLRAQRNQNARLLLHLALQSPQRAEGPAGPAQALGKRSQPPVNRGIILNSSVGKVSLTWFWTGLTKPSSLQSTLRGVDMSLSSSEEPFLK